jgi:erythromycin esterase-like protein
MPQDSRATQRNPLPNPHASQAAAEHLAKNYRKIGISAVAGAATIIKLEDRKEERERVMPAFLREEGI